MQQIDAVALSHEIATDVNNPDEINEIFDDITYSKGGSVIRMSNYFIGNETFNRGITESNLTIKTRFLILLLKEYLKEYVYGNAIQDNLWAVLDKVKQKEKEK